MNKMVVKGKLLVGPILALVGGGIMLMSGYFVFSSIALNEAELTGGGLSWADVGFSRELMYIRFILTLLWGVLGIIGGILALMGKKFGSILALIGGILGIAGMFIPLGTITIVIPVPVSISGSFLFVDAALMLIGGILGLALKE